MTSYTFDRNDVIKIFMFLSRSAIMPSLVVIGPQIKEKDMGPPYSLYFNQKSQGWISDMGIDGPTFVPKSGYFLPILVKVCPQKLAFS